MVSFFTILECSLSNRILLGNRRQVIFATNVAETSITVPNVTVVVDSGVCKEQRFDPLRKVTVLKIGKVSQSSARQRMGRAGRTAAGTCYRMYSEVRRPFHYCQQSIN